MPQIFLLGTVTAGLNKFATDSLAAPTLADHAPVELLGMNAIDRIIADEAGPYRDLLREEGIGGLLRALR